jgi:Aspartyl/Asparaginyl beta-hydroxylase
MSFTIQLTIDQNIMHDMTAITIDNCAAIFTINDNVVEVTADVVGFHLLKLTNKSNTKFKIVSVKVGGCDLRKLLYLSYLETHTGQKLQPATELWEKNQTWVLPFGYPLSHWVASVEEKISDGTLGKNLLDDYCFYYPESIRLEPGKFPQIIQDFYEYNFNFTMVSKKSLNAIEIPYMRYCKEISNKSINDATNEISNNLELIMRNGLEYSMHNDNVKEFQPASDDSAWRIVWLKKNNQITKLVEQFPAVQKLIDCLNLNHWHAFIGVLPPGGFIYPHKDFVMHRLENKEFVYYQGCAQLYIPLQWPAGNYIKFANVGALAMESNDPMVINTDYFTHCVINDSDQTRYILGIRVHHDILNDCDFNF